MKLFSILARAADWLVHNFNEQSLANMEWAFATVCQPDAQLLMALARMAEWRQDEFSA